jgi:hypothetical protein
MFTIIFQQSQATNTNAEVTATAQVQSTLILQPTQPFTAMPIVPVVTLGSEDVTIQYDVPTVTPVYTSVPPNVTTATATSTPTSTPSPLDLTASPDVPRHSGTSSYPMTITAEVMLAQTNVASYQAGVAATRTAIAAESASIYATLTASAPTLTPEA